MNAISAIMGLEGTVASAAGALAGGIADLKEAQEKSMAEKARKVLQVKMETRKENNNKIRTRLKVHKSRKERRYK